jgi:endonuclease-3
MSEKIEKTIETIHQLFPFEGALSFDSEYYTIVAVLLSARTKDEQVLKLLPKFFKRFPTTKHLAEADAEEIAEYLKMIGMFRQKAKNLCNLGKIIESDFDGKFPRSLEELIKLPGVGRKTASVALPYLYGVPAIAVDVHVHRVANRLGWVRAKSPADTEKQLLKKISPQFQAKINQSLVKFGRYICTAQKPKCDICPIAEICPVKNINRNSKNEKNQVWSNIIKSEEEIVRLKKEVVNYAKKD